jgi:hypothetical protein
MMVRIAVMRALHRHKRRLPDGFRGFGVEAPRSSLSGRPVEVLGKVKNRKHPAMSRVMV